MTGVDVSKTQVVDDTDGTLLTETYVQDGCDRLLVMFFNVNGTYVSCDDGSEFPGLFDVSSSSSQSRGADRYRQLLVETERTSNDITSQLRGSVPDGRSLEEDGGRTCG